MERFAPAVAVLEVGDRRALWHRRTGRHVILDPAVLSEVEQWVPGLPPPPDLRGVAQRLDRMYLLRESEQPDPEALIPARSRMVLVLPQLPALWLPVPTSRTTGGYAYTERRLSMAELRVWRACNGARSVRAVAERAKVPVVAVLDFLGELSDPAWQAVQLRDQPLRRRDPSLCRLLSIPRPASEREDDMYGLVGETTLERWHERSITDGETHFDDRETTVAHTFAVPHRALDGQTYGHRLHAALDERGLLPQGDEAVLEVGPGDGELGAAWLERTAHTGRPTGEYLRLDASPELLATQRRRTPGTRGILGSATSIPLPDASVGLVVSNEVMADLAAVPYDPEESHPDGAAAEVADRLERYRITPFPHRALYNLGAWKLVEEVARLLTPGGAAVLTEFGGIDEEPKETTQLDHPEVSIHFGHLQEVARSLGLDAQVIGVAELMDFDLSATWLARHSYDALRARMRAHGAHFEARAWTVDTLNLPFAVEGLEEVPVSEDGPGPVVTRFQALVLRRSDR